MFKMSEFIKSLQVNQAKNPRENRDEKFYKIYDKNREGKKIYRGRTIKEANSEYYLGGVSCFVINEDGKSLMLLDTIKDNRYENNVDFMLLHDEIEKLPNDEKRLLMERYFYDKTQSEIAKLMGVNQVQVSRCEKKILKKLKNNLCRPL